MPWLLRALFVASLLLSGCSDDEVDLYEPNPLVDIDNQFETEEIWSVSIGDGNTDLTVKIEPVYAYQKIFVADGSGVVMAVSPSDGKEIWRTELEVAIGGGPEVASNIVAVGTQDGELIVLDAQSGEVKWRKPVSSEVISSPAIGQGAVVVRTVDGKVSAFDADSGDKKWTYDQSIPALTLRGVSSPVIAGGGVISGFSNGKLAVFILENGRLAWERTITAPVGTSEIQRLVDVDVKPLLGGQTIYVSAYNGNLTNLQAQNGQILWQRELSSFKDIVLSELLLLVTHDNSHVSAVDRSNGIILWTQKDLHQRRLTSPMALGDHIAVADFEGYLHWLNRKDGTMVSREHVDSSGFGATPLIVDDKIVLLSHDGTLYALKKK